MSQQIIIYNNYHHLFWKRHLNFRGKLGSDFWKVKQQTFSDTEVELTTIAEKSASG